MTTFVLLLLALAFAWLAWSAWRHRSDGDPASSVEGFARVLAAIDPEAIRRREEQEAALAAGRPAGGDPGGDADEHRR